VVTSGNAKVGSFSREELTRRPQRPRRTDLLIGCNKHLLQQAAEICRRTEILCHRDAP
jgi:hypothetical protein